MALFRSGFPLYVFVPLDETIRRVRAAYVYYCARTTVANGTPAGSVEIRDHGRPIGGGRPVSTLSSAWIVSPIRSEFGPSSKMASPIFRDGRLNRRYSPSSTFTGIGKRNKFAGSRRDTRFRLGRAGHCRTRARPLDVPPTERVKYYGVNFARPYFELNRLPNEYPIDDDIQITPRGGL